MPVLNNCDCSGTTIPNNNCRCEGCISINQKQIEKRIQNQIGVSNSQMLDVKKSITIGSDYLNNPINTTELYPFKNMSDRRMAHFIKNNNVPTRGNSLRSSVTGNRPGSMAPGGKGVDVKHGSYARYLGKLKSKNIISNEIQQNVNLTSASRTRAVTNNKQFRFSIINTSNCKCNGNSLFII